MLMTSTITGPEGVIRIEADYVLFAGEYTMVARAFFLNGEPISEREVSLLAAAWVDQANPTGIL